MHFDQNVIFIIIAAVIGISRLIARIAENAREQAQQRKPSAPRRTPSTTSEGQPKTDEQRVRELLEALGQPTTASPPPKVQPRSDIPPRTLKPVQPPRPMAPLPPLVKRARQQARKILQPSRPRRDPARPPLAPAEANEPGTWIREEEKIESAAAAFERVAGVEKQAATIAAPTDRNWKEALQSPDSIRSAIVLREVLGPPRALRDSDF